MYLNSFPQLSNPAYDSKTFLRRFNEENTIIHATCGEVSYAEHTANLSFKLALSGKEYYQVSDVPISVNNQSFLLLNHGQRYASWIEPKTQVESFSVFFTKEFASDILTNLILPEDILVDNPAQDLQPVLFFEKLYRLEAPVIQLILRLNHILRSGQKTDDLQVEESLHAMLGYLIETHRGERKKVAGIEALKLSTRVEIYKRLSRATDYINTCFTEPITLKQLSAICCLSENHLLRHFKKTFHSTPHAYITNRRLEYASTLLKTTDMPVNEIAQLSGFFCASAFGRLFKHHFHTTPLAYRNSSAQ